MDLGIGELVVIFLVVLLLFGAGRLPGLGEGLGKAIRGFKDSLRGEPGPRRPAGTQRELPTEAPPAERKDPS